MSGSETSARFVSVKIPDDSCLTALTIYLAMYINHTLYQSSAHNVRLNNTIGSEDVSSARCYQERSMS
jgi:hypothetical protein